MSQASSTIKYDQIKELLDEKNVRLARIKACVKAQSDVLGKLRNGECQKENSPNMRRILAELAAAASVTPVQMFEIAGIAYEPKYERPYLDAMKRLNEKAREIKSPTGPPSVTSRPLAEMPLDGKILASARSNANVRFIFSNRSNEAAGDFEKKYALRLCSIINHRWSPIVLVDSNEEKQLTRMLQEDPTIHVAAGLLDTLDRASLGLAFIPYPGLYHCLDAVQVLNNRSSISWSDIRPAQRDIYVIGTRGDVGDSYVRGVLGYSEKLFHRFRSLDDHTQEGIIAELVKAAESPENKYIVYCGVDDVCQKLIRAAKDQGRLNLDLVEKPRASTRSLPCFAAGMLVPHDVQWISLLNKATHVMMDSATEEIAELYAERLARNIATLDSVIDHGYAYCRIFGMGIYKSLEFLKCLESALFKKLMKNLQYSESTARCAVDYALEKAKEGSAEGLEVRR